MQINAKAVASLDKLIFYSLYLLASQAKIG